MKHLSSFLFALPAGLTLLCSPASFGAVSFSVTPAAVSNTFNGALALQLGGLAGGDKVVVQKFLDLNTNGVIDVADLPLQQFNLTNGQAGMVIGGVTNFNVPGDTNPAADQITTALNFNNGDFVQILVGKYLYKVSSPSGLFTPVTNLFTVTNFPFAQKFTGNVVSNGTSTGVPNAVILLFPPPRPGHGLGRVLAGTVADNAGGYTIRAPAGTYSLLAFRNGFLTDTSVLPVVSLGAGATLITNLALTNTTTSISGTLVDAANAGIGIPGVMMAAQADNGLLGVSSTDTNGNYSLGVRAGQWRINGLNESLVLPGYVEPSDDTNLSAGATGVLIRYPKATALMYGSVNDTLGNPLAGVGVNVSDYYDSLYDLDGLTDLNGKYVIGLVGGLGANDPWFANVGNDNSNPANYVFSQPAFNQNGGTNIGIGQAVLVNFTGLLGTNLITGHVQANGTNIVGVGVYATMTTNGQFFNANVDTDAGGNFSFHVADGNWQVGVNCNGGDNSLDGILGGANYQCPNSQDVGINHGNGSANFFVPICTTVQIITTSLPAGQVNVDYDQLLEAASCSGSLTWTLNDPQNFPGGLDLDPDGEIFGVPDTAGTFSFSIHVHDGNGRDADRTISLVISNAVPDVLAYYVGKEQDFFQTDATTVVPDTVYGPFNAYLGIVQSGLGLVSIANVTLPTSVVKGFPSGNTAIELQVREPFVNQPALDAAYPAGNYSFAISAVNDGNLFPVLSLPSAAYPNAPRVSNYAAAQAVNPNLPFLLQWDAFSGGRTNDSIWCFILDNLGARIFSTPPPATDPGGALKGTATSVTVPAGTLQLGSNYLGVIVFFKVTGTNTTGYPGAVGGTFAESETTFGLATLPATPSLGQPIRASATQFGFNLGGVPGSTYTVLTSTNLGLHLSNWLTLVVTNLPSTPVFIQDNQATNKQRFYRARLGP